MWRRGGIGHELLIIILHFIRILQSTLDPVSAPPKWMLPTFASPRKPSSWLSPSPQIKKHPKVSFNLWRRGDTPASQSSSVTHFALGTSSSVSSAEETWLRCSIPTNMKQFMFSHLHGKNPFRGFFGGEGGNRTPV